VIDGDERWIAVSGVEFEQGRVYALQDVTEEHALEKTRSDFVTTASHELRTPLAAVYGAIRTLRREDLELSEDERAQFLEMIESEATRLARLVDQILLAGQLDADAVELEVTECDPTEIAAGVIESAQVHVSETISLSLDVDGAPKISCDENKLRQVLVNLVDNAVKYSPGGGRVELRVRNGDGSCVIDVVDQGLGIPAGERERIFEKFYRLDPQQSHGVGGSGLGLYICRELVERMDGRLSVESEPGKGSRFTLELPVR
jgi:two-component system, OmpR family, phosphate regulon sensor histidine kinase PhoR